jgi:hypothetical protein
MRAALIAGLALALAPDVARAERLARGVSQPGASLASEDHAEAAATNPAGLGFGGDFDLTLTAMDAARDRSGEGLAAHFALGLLDPWHTALGVELLEAPGRQTAEPVKVTWANSVRFSDRFALGLAWHTFAADADPALRSLSTLDLGVSLRPWRALSLGVVATDVATPLVQGAPLPRGWEFGLALRPGQHALAHSLGVAGLAQLAFQLPSILFDTAGAFGQLLRELRDLPRTLVRQARQELIPALIDGFAKAFRDIVRDAVKSFGLDGRRDRRSNAPDDGRQFVRWQDRQRARHSRRTA